MKKITKTTLFGFALFFFSAVCFAQCLTTVSTRYNHNVGLKSDGTIWGWGWGNWGQLSNTTEFDEYSPISIASGNWQLIKGGTYNTFAIKTNGTLWGCGSNEHGCLGIGSMVDHMSNLVQIGVANDWKQIAPANSFSIALRTNSTLWSWGSNNYYELGDGTTTQRNNPVQISNDTDWKIIGSTTAGASFAIKNNGTIWGWGSNISGLLGDNLLSNRTIPTQHNMDIDWKNMSVGTAHILVLKTNGTLWAWGGGDSGETGDGLPVMYNRYIPRQIGTDTNWKTMAAGERFSMGIKTDGTLWAWGKNDVGQLGNGTTTNQPFPIQIGTATNWDTVACGFQHSIALKTDGSVWTWGLNDFGQIGNGTTTAAGTPTNIAIDGCVLATADFTTTTANLIINPNPVKNDLNLSYKGSESVDTVVIYDMAGREVYSSKSVTAAVFSCTLNVSKFQGGSYVVVLKNGGKTVVSKKMIKE